MCFRLFNRDNICDRQFALWREEGFVSQNLEAGHQKEEGFMSQDPEAGQA